MAKRRFYVKYTFEVLGPKGGKLHTTSINIDGTSNSDRDRKAKIRLDEIVARYPSARSALINTQKYAIEDGVSRFVGFQE